MKQVEFSGDVRRRIEISVEHPARVWFAACGNSVPAGRRLPQAVLIAWQQAGCPLPSRDALGTGTWAILIERFLFELQVDGYSSETLRAYRYRLVAFVREIHPAQPSEVSREVVREYLGAHPNWQPDMHNSVRSVLSAFFRWALARDEIVANPTASIGRVRVPIRVPLPATEPVIRDAINSARPDVRLMVLFGALAGLRRSEITYMHTACVTEHGLRIVGKGGRMRLVPLHAFLADEIETYRSWRGLTDGYFFTNPASQRPLTPSHVGRLISRQMPPGVTTHKLRHRFASKAYAGTYDIRAVQELLGHSSPSVTARYVAAPERSLIDAVAAVPAVAGVASRV